MSSRHTTPVPGSTANSPVRDVHGTAPLELSQSPLDDHTPPHFLDGYDDPSADVVLVGSDRVGLRVKDYYLKAASEFFCSMLEAGTRGGPVPLEATSLQLMFFMDRIWGKVPRWETLKELAMTAPRTVILDGWHAIWALLRLKEIVDKYLLVGVSEYVAQLIINYAEQNPPAVLFRACESSPIDSRMAVAALKAFRNEMPIWMNEYFERSEYNPRNELGKQHYFIPHATNLRLDFVEALGLRVFYAYSQALKAGSVLLSNAADQTFVKHTGYDWNVVTETFMATMAIPQHPRSWPLHHDNGDAASTWSTGSTIMFPPSEHPSDRSLTPPFRRPLPASSLENSPEIVEERAE